MKKLYSKSVTGSDFKGSSQLANGQIRRVVDMDSRNDSRLALVLKFNIEDDSAYVVLVSNLVEIATERDLLLPSSITGSSFDLALLADFKVRVWKEQIEQSPIYGAIDSPVLQEIRGFIGASMDIEGELRSHPKLLEEGSYIPEFGDHVWKFRSNEIDAINTLGHFEVQQISTDRFLSKWNPSLSDEKTLDVVIQEKMDVDEVYLYILTNDAIRCERV